MPARLLRSPTAALSFLTRLPVRADRVTAEDLGRSVGCFPLVGLLLGVALAGAASAASAHVAPMLLAILLVALLALVTGGLHLDGLADTFDGLGGGRGDRERTLAIMRDGRSGPHGVAALVLLLALKIVATAQAIQAGDLAALALAPAVARGAVVGLIVLFPYARTEGLGQAFRGHAGRWGLVLAWSTTAAMVVLGGPWLALPAVAALGAALGVALVLWRKLGGLTGDVYGAAIELAEVAFLAAAHPGKQVDFGRLGALACGPFLA